MTAAWDVIVIGSGASGGVLAHELTAGGARCLLLEAGRAFDARSFPPNEMDYSTQLFWNGGVDPNTDGDLVFLRAKCLGGTTVVNQALLDRFDDRAWGDWTAETGVEFFSGAEMVRHYEAVEARLSLQQIPPEHYNQNTKLFIRGHDQLGHKWKPLRRGQRDCDLAHSDCISCLGGCRRNSKQSTLVTYIAWAQEKGLTVRPDFQVEHLELGGGVVRVLGREKGVAADVVGGKVVLAAGAFGNTQILLRSGLGSSLPALGQGFACHPQMMTFAAFDEPVNAHKGAFQGCSSHDPSFRERGFKLENVFAPPISVAMLFAGFGRQHQERMRKYRNYACIEVAVRDEASGRIGVGKNGKLQVHKRLTDRDKKRTADGLGTVRRIFEAVGARDVYHAPFQFGLHLMGGCRIGTKADRSVVGPTFQVHGQPQLYAADSSVFPSAPGINPSLSIMALSHRAAAEVLK